MDPSLSSPRHRALDRLDLLSGLPAPALRRTARLAAHIARQPGGEPLAALHLLDDVHQHRLASSGGAPLVRTPIGESMCVQVLEEDRAVYTSDATAEPRFEGNPFTSGPDPVRLYYSTPVRTMDGTAIGTLCVFATVPGELDDDQRARLDDLAEQTGSHLELTGLSREIAHLATHDPLTGLANRLLLSQRLDEALQDGTSSPAILLLDLDDFKGVNDGHGHAVGDEVLRSTAQRVLGAVRGRDLVARLGGDELAVLLNRCPDETGFDELVDRVVHAGAEPHDTSVGPVPCTVSVGRAAARPGELAYELMGRADADMYARKVVRAGSLPG